MTESHLGTLYCVIKLIAGLQITAKNADSTNGTTIGLAVFMPAKMTTRQAITAKPRNAIDEELPPLIM